MIAAGRIKSRIHDSGCQSVKIYLISLFICTHCILSEEQPVFGVSLHLAVERSCCHDGVELPLVVRDCIDYVEEHGMNVEGLYKVPGVKSKVQHLKKLYNHRETVNISEFEPTVATSLLILFLRFVSLEILSRHHVFLRSNEKVAFW